MSIRLALITAAVAFLGALTPAVAGCYEGQGCTNSTRFSERFLLQNAECSILWQIRNQIYHENGYCFRTARGIGAFGNAGCRHDDIEEVSLNQFERERGHRRAGRAHEGLPALRRAAARLCRERPRRCAPCT